MLELGNIMFNTNSNQNYECPQYIIALLEDIERRLKIKMWNKYHKEYESPFENSGNTFENKVFKVQAYSWDEDVNQDYNFIYYVDKTKSNMPDLKISWYKYLGRDTTINQEIDSNVMVDIYNDCINSLINVEEDDEL